MFLRRNIVVAALFVLLTACGGGDTSTANNPEQQVQVGNVAQGADNIKDVTLPNSGVAQEAGASEPGQKLLAFTYGPYTPYGWIDDQFTRSFIYVMTGGSGASAFLPPKKSEPTPRKPSNVGGLEAYEIPAQPIWRDVPLDIAWNGVTLNTEMREYMRTTMACAPACTMVIADILATAPLAKRPSLGAPPGSDLTSLGNETLDRFAYDWGSPRREEFEQKRLILLANAIDLKNDRLLAAWTALDKLIDKAQSSLGRLEYQYALVADQDGTYPDTRYGSVKMKKLEVWKYGTSLDPDHRYSQAYLKKMGVSMVIESEGTKEQVLVQEKIKLIDYYTNMGELPPGNKIFK